MSLSDWFPWKHPRSEEKPDEEITMLKRQIEKINHEKQTTHDSLQRSLAELNHVSFDDIVMDIFRRSAK